MIATLSKPDITTTPDGYVVHWEEAGVKATVERLDEHSGDLTCELAIASTRLLSEGVLLSPARFNLMAPRTRSEIARKVAGRDPDLDWEGMVEQLVVGVLEKHRQGEPTIDMRFFVPTGKPLWHINPFMETGGPTVLFGDGGQGKTTAAIAIAVSLASGAPLMGVPQGSPAPVMFLDYEGQADQFYSRLHAVCEAATIPLPPVHYRREYASLPEGVQAARREVVRLGCQTVFVDNVGLACGGDPQAADVTLAFFRAVDSLRVPALLIDHVTKNGGEDQTKAYGSVYKHNRPRLAWRLRSRPATGYMAMAMTEHKHNNVGPLPQQNYRVRFEADKDGWPTAIAFGSGDRRDFPSEGTLAQRIVDELVAEPAHREHLVVALGRPLAQVNARVAELLRDGTIRKERDGKLWVVAKGDN